MTEATSELTGAQRKYLRGLAHSLKPIAHIGKAGISDALLANLEELLSCHELIKVKFLDFQDEKDELLSDVETRLDCERAGVIGHTAVLYRQAREPERRHIRLPK